MFFHLGRRRTSSSASGNTGKRPPEEQFDEEEEKSFDPLSYRLQHLNQQGCSSSSGMNRHDVDPFDVGSSAGSSSSDDQSEVMEVGVVKMGAVDDVGWGAKSNNGSDYYDDDDCYHDEDELFVDFGGRTPDQVRARRRQKEILSTPRFGGGGSSQSSHSRWDSTEHSRQSLSTISCTKNHDNDEPADIGRHHNHTESSMEISNEAISPHARSMPLVEQMIAAPSPKTTPNTQRSVGKTSRRAPSISTLSTLSSPTDNCMRYVTPADIPSSVPPPPLSYKQISRRQSSSSLSKEEGVSKAIAQTDKSNLVEVSIVSKTVETQEEKCPRLEQLQQMSVEELEFELMTIQAQSKANLENSWKAAERMRVENSELDRKAEGLKTKLESAFSAGPPVNRRHSDSVKSDDYELDVSIRSMDYFTEVHMFRRLSQVMGGEDLKSSRSMANLTTEAWPKEEKDASGDVIAAFTLDLETPAATLRQKNIRHFESSSRSGASSDSEFGFHYDISQSDMKSPFTRNNQAGLDQSNSSSDLSGAKSGVYYPRKVLGDNTPTIIKVIETDSFGGNASRKPGFKRGPSLDGDQSPRSASSSGGGLKRRPSMLNRRPSFMGLFRLNDSSKAGSEVSSERLDDSNYNQSTASGTESTSNISGNIFQVEARSIMIEELEKELEEKGDIVTDLIDKIEGQREDIDNCEVDIKKLRSKIDDEYNELTCTQSTLQQSVKEFIRWDSAIESRLDQTEGRRQHMKQKERNLRSMLASKESTEAHRKIELKQQMSRCKEEYNVIQEKSSVSLSMIIDSLRAMNCDNNLEQSSKQLFDSLDTQTDKMYNLLGDSDRIASFYTLKKHIEEQRDRVINAYDSLFHVETDLRGNLIRLKLKEEDCDECAHTTESSLESERSSLERTFAESVLPHLVEAREEHARFVFAAVTKVDEFLSWWDHLLAADSKLEDCEVLADAVNISSILEQVLADVTEDLAATQAKIDEEYDLFKSNLLSAGIQDQQCSSKKLSTSKDSNVESRDYQAELDNLNEQVSSLETSLSERQEIRKEYASKLDQLHKEDEADSKANLELLDNIQAQVRILAEKLAMDDDQIASLRQSLREKKELVKGLEHDKKRRDIMHS
jgi:hypothetical protein